MSILKFRIADCALLDLTDSYAVSAGLLDGGGVWLQPGEEAWALGGQPIYPTVPEKLWKQGITEIKDLLKLIVSTAEFDATLLELGERKISGEIEIATNFSWAIVTNINPSKIPEIALETTLYSEQCAEYSDDQDRLELP